MMGKGVVLRTEAVTKTYPMGEVYVSALRGIDLAIETGQLVVLLGASGSGKSTLLNIVRDTPFVLACYGFVTPTLCRNAFWISCVRPLFSFASRTTMGKPPAPRRYVTEPSWRPDRN